jgi:hypothetical protein
MPIEDSMLLMEYGTPKEGRYVGGKPQWNRVTTNHESMTSRFISGRGHMGYPEALSVVFSWLETVMNKS